MTVGGCLDQPGDGACRCGPRPTGSTTCELSETERLIAVRVLREIRERLSFLDDVGVGYLSLDRAAATLSGGEAQRIRLATQIGSSLVGVLYILDEPSIGLHQRDNRRLIETLTRLRDLGNTVVIVEHDEDTMRASDWLIDMGLGAGEHGGRVIAEGTPEEVERNTESITGGVRRAAGARDRAGLAGRDGRSPARPGYLAAEARGRAGVGAGVPSSSASGCPTRAAIRGASPIRVSWTAASCCGARST